MDDDGFTREDLRSLAAWVRFASSVDRAVCRNSLAAFQCRSHRLTAPAPIPTLQLDATTGEGAGSLVGYANGSALANYAATL
jgi:hypothetical protein